MPTDISKIVSDAAYQAYERRLLHQVRQSPMPNHVAIIMDGNRRFAREIGLGNILDGHAKGRDKLEEVLEWCLEVGVRILTVRGAGFRLEEEGVVVRRKHDVRVGDPAGRRLHRAGAC